MDHTNMTSKKRLTIIAKFIIDTCSLDEIEILCTSLLYARLCVKKSKA